MRRTDLLKSTLESIEHLEAEFRDSLNSDFSQTARSVEIKNRLDALRIYVCSEMKASIINGERRRMKKKKAA